MMFSVVELREIIVALEARIEFYRDDPESMSNSDDTVSAEQALEKLRSIKVDFEAKK